MYIADQQRAISVTVTNVHLQSSMVDSKKLAPPPPRVCVCLEMADPNLDKRPRLEPPQMCPTNLIHFRHYLLIRQDEAVLLLGQQWSLRLAAIAFLAS